MTSDYLAAMWMHWELEAHFLKVLLENCHGKKRSQNLIKEQSEPDDAQKSGPICSV